MSALVFCTGTPLACGCRTHLPQLAHVHLLTLLQEAFDHPVVAPGAENRPALRQDTRIASIARECLAPESVRELMGSAEHRAVPRRPMLQRIERGGQSRLLQRGEHHRNAPILRLDLPFD